MAPGAAGAARSKGDLILASSGSGKEILLFENRTGQLSRYGETGDLWGKPVILRDSQGQPFSAPAVRMDVGTGVVAFSSLDAVHLFKIEDGALLRRSRAFFLASDIAQLPSGDWALGLLQLPDGEGEILGGKKNGPDTPRLVSVNSKLEVVRSGLGIGDEERTGNQAAARTLRLTASKDRVFAAEVANYKIYELDRRLQLHATYSEPSLQLEKGRSTSPPAKRAEQDRRLKEAVEKNLERGGSDATAPRKAPAMEGGYFQFAQAVNDIAWDSHTNRLVLLLHRNTAGAANALDTFDPTTGEVRRVILQLPAGVPQVELAQLAVGYRFIWLRGRSGNTPTFRLDRAVLDQATPVATLSPDGLEPQPGR